MTEQQKKKELGGKAFIPFLVFIGVYLFTGIVLNWKNVKMPFYQLPAPVAAFAGVITAFLLFQGT